GLRALRRHPPRDAGLRTRAGRARQRALPHRRGFPGMGACALGRPGLHDLAGVQEDLHGRTQRPGRCRGAVRAARGPAARGGRDTSRLRGTTMNVAVHGPTLRPLPPVATQVDAALVDIDAGLDWLLALTPLGTDALWDDFQASGHFRVAPLRYAEPALDLDAMRRRLLELPIERIESPLLAGVLGEKQRELDRMIELVRLRGTDGFVSASIDLFGGVEPGLLELAHAILDGVGDSEPLEADIGVDAVVAAVADEIAWYRERAPDFSLDIVVDAHIGSLMVGSPRTPYLAAPLLL